MYGISVYAYVIEQRLERAAGLSLESNMHIGQIAVLVGYTKPSNFSAAFKKKDGVMPKDYREASRIDVYKRQARSMKKLLYPKRITVRNGLIMTIPRTMGRLGTRTIPKARIMNEIYK